MVSGGRLRQLTGPESGAPVAGPLGSGEYDVQSAASTVDGQRMAAVIRQGPRRALLIGPAGAAVAPAPLTATSMTRPSWVPTGLEAWTVLDGRTVARVLVDPDGARRTGGVEADELTAARPDHRPAAVPGRDAGGGGGQRWALHRGRGPGGIDGRWRSATCARCARSTSIAVVAADWRAADSIVAITRGADLLVAQVSVDGLGMQPVLGNNLTPPLTAVAATSNRALLVTDQTGVWSFGGGDQAAWRQVLGGATDAVPLYPG